MKERFGDKGLDLVVKMLHPEPSQRLTIEQVMAHPWLKDCDPIMVAPANAATATNATAVPEECDQENQKRNTAANTEANNCTCTHTSQKRKQSQPITSEVTTHPRKRTKMQLTKPAVFSLPSTRAFNLGGSSGAERTKRSQQIRNRRQSK